MPRKKTPASAAPTAIDPRRLEQLVAEFERRLRYIESSYYLWKTRFGEPNAFNACRADIKRALNGHKLGVARTHRVHPELELLISEGARRAVAARSLSDPKITPEDVRNGARFAIEVTKPRRGRPEDRILTFHVEALVALVEEMGGKPVRSTKTKNSVYDPQMSDGVSKVIEMFFRKIDPSVTKTQLSNLVTKIRCSRQRREEPTRFIDLFPFYGGDIDPVTGDPIPGPGFRLDRFELIMPIYCP